MRITRRDLAGSSPIGGLAACAKPEPPEEAPPAGKIGAALDGKPYTAYLYAEEGDRREQGHDKTARDR